MTFWKLSDTRMNCLITQEEIETLGFHIDELMNDRERTVELLNLLAMKGKEALGMDLQMTVQSFYGAFLPDRSLLLTITCGAEAGEAVGTVQQESGDIFKKLLAEREDQEGEILTYQVLFSTLDGVIDFCCQTYPSGGLAESHGGSRLYKYDEIYYLMMDFEDTKRGRSDALKIVAAGEFGGIVDEDVISEVFLKEHECSLIEEGAVEKLCGLE